MSKQKEICYRCKREVDWEFKELLKNSPKEHLIKMVLALKKQLNQTGGYTNGN